MKKMLMTFIKNPVFSISFKAICPLENAMALGGVPMGSMPAQLAPRHIGMPSSNGLMFNETAKDVTTGEKMITCATLLITSLIKTDNVVIKSISKNKLPGAICASISPSS